MGSPSPDLLDTIRTRLGDLQALAASISQASTSRHVSAVFAHMADLIYVYYGDTRISIQETTHRCQKYLQSHDQTHLIQMAPECEAEITHAYDETNSMYDLMHPSANTA